MLSALPDSRRAQGIRYSLHSVVVIALMGAVCGCDDAQSMELWGELNTAWLETFLPLPHGTPSQDVFLSVFGALNSQAFGDLFRAWAELLILRCDKQSRHIAIDDKTSRRSADKKRGTKTLRTVSAWVREAGLVLGPCRTAEKSNEITAIPELLQLLDLSGATVTIDAMGYQTHIAETIRQGDGHYLLSVKENQPTLHDDAETLFAEVADERVRSVDEAPRPIVERHQEVSKDHGRVETRTVLVCRQLQWITTRESWRDLA